MQVERIMTAPGMKYAISVKDATKCAKEKEVTPPLSYQQAESLIQSLIYKGKNQILSAYSRQRCCICPHC